MIATYSLSDKSPSYEFFMWLVLVKAKGATQIVIDTRQPKLKNTMTLEDVTKRVKNILLPGPALAGLPCRLGHDGHQVSGSAPEFIKWVRTNKFERLRALRVTPCSYTVTIRKQQAAPGRNSNEEAWRQFAREIGAVVIEEHAVAPIDLHERMALYAGAKMNFGVCNGPVATLALTPYPVIQFVNSDAARNSQKHVGILSEVPRYPWMLENQRLIWQEDTIENLRKALC